MFHADITFVLGLIALVAGAALIFSVKSNKEALIGLCTFIGYAVIALSIIIILCCGYGVVRGHFMRRGMMRQMMRRGRMMPMMHRGKMMPMMQKQMKPGMKMKRGNMPMKGLPPHR